MFFRVIFVAERHGEDRFVGLHLSNVQHFLKIVEHQTVFFESGWRNPMCLEVASIFFCGRDGIEIAVGGIFNDPFAIG